MTNDRNHIKIFVSSTVYDFEPQLEQVYAMLDSYGYDVYMSKMGTVPINSKLNNFINCTKGVEECDVFLGFIRPLLGTGIYDRRQPSVTEMEFDIALKKGILRFILADYKIEFAHQYLNLTGQSVESIPEFKEKITNNEDGSQNITRIPNRIIHPQCVTIYRKVIQSNIPQVMNRIGNWVQPYNNINDIRRFIEAQFQDVTRIKELLKNGK